MEDAESLSIPSFSQLHLKIKQFSLSPNVQNYAFSNWVNNNLQKKQCCFFQKGKSEDVCKCGYLKDEHTDEAIKPENFTGETWDKHRHVSEVPTDAFGSISFGGSGQNSGKYARVSADTSSEVLYHLLIDQWKLSPPNLLISVTGGAKNFHLKTSLKNVFHRGLIKVAETTGAWIITGGTNTGVMKHVGQAVRDHALSSTKQSNIVAIGVATWGIIHNREQLVDPQGSFPAHYVMDVQGQGRLSCLDNNHTHFLLVDDGTHGEYGVEIELRSRLEKCISGKLLRNKDCSVTIPVVCVVLDGGTGTLETICNAMLNGTPCVVLEGSGRIADVIAHANQHSILDITINRVHQLMEMFFGQEYKKFTNIIDCTKKIQDIIRMSHLLTVFRVSEDSQGDVDMAILQALLKASKSNQTAGREVWQRQLELAIAWNRVDIAETEIFKEESQWKSSDLHWAMLSALVGNKPRFVSLLLEHGVRMKYFLEDEDTLCELYKQLPSCFFLCKLAKRVDSTHSKRKRKNVCKARPFIQEEPAITLSDVSDVVRHLLGEFTQPIYPPTTITFDQSLSTSLTLSKCEAASQDRAGMKRDTSRDLFLWAVVQNNKQLAEIAWEQCGDCTAAGLAAGKILKKMAEEAGDADEAKEMLKLAAHYEKHAIGVFSKCYSCDEERAQKLLVRVTHSWGGTTCLRLALEANSKDFVALSGVQGLLNQIWCGELSVDNPVWRVLICMVFFPLMYNGFLTFRREELIDEDKKKRDEIASMESMKGNTMRKNRFGKSRRLKPLACWSKMMSFYSSPQVKFYWNIASYFAFLFLFAMILTADFQKTPSSSELLLYIWLFSLVCEEIRQLFYDPDGFGFKKKAWMYIKDLWNILDVISILLFITGVAFRLTTQLFYPGKIILCIDYVVFCLRLMAIFTISRTLGPKIIIVRRMVMDMFFFLFLLSIWVVAYGVAKQGILIDNDNRLDWILRGVIYEPYLIIFGNFPTDTDYAGFEQSNCSPNATDALKPKCPMLNEDQLPVFPEWLTIIMLCVYLLFANILLLNLLIAIFNYTFQEVQDNTDKIWKFQRCEVIKEYHSRPSAPPPFILLSHVFIFIKSIILRRPHTKYKEFKNALPLSEEEELMSWEALMKDRYLHSVQQAHNDSIEKHILDMSKKVAAMNERQERDEETRRRMIRLEVQVTQTTKALQEFMDAMKSHGFVTKETQSPTLEMSLDKFPDSSGRISEREVFHVKARHFSYLNTKHKRFPVPDEKVPWDVPFSSYEPTYYSAEKHDDHVDGSNSEVLDEFRNPGGRTGIRGRGALSHLGPNFNLDIVVTRWRENKSGLDILLVEDEKQGTLALPGGFVTSADHLPATLKQTLGEKLYETLDVKLSRGQKVLEGYVDDSRNTDNAWVEIIVINIHLDLTPQEMMEINEMVARCNGGLHWQEVSRKIRLSSIQRNSVQKVAELHKRKFSLPLP